MNPLPCTRSARIPVAIALALALLAACEPASEHRGTAGMAGAGSRAATVDTTGLRDLPVPAEYRPGAQLFATHCVTCHGEAALGTGQGPPLVHIVYEPNHHADVAFLLAVERGVRAHHWRFGDMPPVPGLAREEVAEIVGYVRWLQREAGVY
jgi:mono/diheme cytochrome c family protein